MSSRFDKLVSGHKPSVDVEVMNDEAPRDVKTRYLRLGDLERHPSNRAVHERNVEWIAESIEKEQMLYQPIMARPIGQTEDGRTRYQIVDGEHRWRAVGMLAEKYPDDPKYKTIRAEVRRMTDIEAEACVLSANLYRVELTREEKQSSYLKLVRLAPDLRKEFPEAYSGMRSEDVAYSVLKEKAKPGEELPSPATIRREAAKAASRELLEKSGGLAGPWAEKAESEKIDDRLLAKLSKLDEKEQLDIFAEFEGADGSRIWLAQEMQLRDDRQAEKLVARAERDLSSNARLMARAKAKGRELDEAAIRSAIENLARLLEG